MQRNSAPNVVNDEVNGLFFGTTCYQKPIMARTRLLSPNPALCDLPILLYFFFLLESSSLSLIYSRATSALDLTASWAS